MITNNNPKKCPSCKSNNIKLGACTYKKDEDGLDTDKIISGSWFCHNCGECIGRYENRVNDISENSI